MDTFTCTCGYRIELSEGEAAPQRPCPRCGKEASVPPQAETLTMVSGTGFAGSPDDGAVTLPPARSDATTLVIQGCSATPSVEEALSGTDGGEGRYVEQGIIGRGGMGEVALCVDRSIRRAVAMKRILPAAVDDAARRSRFVEEAQVTGQLEHPNIVPVHELDRDEQGRIYFTMKVVRGRSLADIVEAMKRGDEQTSLGDLLQIFLKVCDGVAYAHSRGVVHRDLKPANVMVGDFGEVLVMDWGLAKIVGREDIHANELVTSDRLEATSELTIDGTAMGTPAYMPPEQANGELGKIDHRSDIYSLGAILYELLTLEKPIEGETPLVALAKAAQGQVVPPRQRASELGIPRELAAVAMKCLSQRRRDRYQSATDLHADITRFIDGRGVSAAPDTVVQAMAKLVRRNKPVSAAIAGALVAIVALTVAFVVRLSGERDRAVVSETRAVAARKRAEEAETRATGLVVELKQEGERLIQENYAAKLSLAQGKLRDRVLRDAETLLAKTPERLRHWEWGRLMYSLQPEILHFPVGVMGGYHGGPWLQATADMRRLIMFWEGKAEVWDLANIRRVRAIEGFSALCLLSPRGGILVARGQEVIREDLDSGNELARWQPRTAKVTTLAASSDGAVALVGRADGTAELVRVADGSTAKALPQGKKGIVYAALTRDASRALVRGSEAATVWDVAAGRSLLTVDGFFYHRGTVALSPDGRHVLVARPDQKVALWDVDTGKVIRTFEEQGGWTGAVAFSRDGRRAFTAGSFGLGYWDLETGKLLRRLGSRDDWSSGLLHAPDPRFLLSAHASSAIKVWDIGSDPEADSVLRPEVGTDDAFSCQVALADDGRTAVTTGLGGAIARVLDLESGKVKWRLETRAMVWAVGMTRDGRWAVTTHHDGKATVWDLRTGTAAGSAPYGSTCYCLAVHPDGDRFAVRTGIWSLPGCERLSGPLGKGVCDAAFSPDGSTLLVRSTKEAVLWDAARSRVRARLAVSAGTMWSRSAFLPDSRRVLLGSPEGAVLWDTVSGEVLGRYKVSLADENSTVSGANAVAVSPDGRRGFLGCWDHTIRVWDLETSREVMSFSPYSDAVMSLAISRDGRTLVAGGSGTARSVKVYRALDWRKSPDQLRQEKLARWRARSSAHGEAGAGPGEQD